MDINHVQNLTDYLSMLSEKTNKKIHGTAALSKGIKILNTVGNSETPMQFSEIAQAVDLPKATVHRILNALVEHRMLRYHRSTQTYHLGFRLFELAHRVWEDFDIRSSAEPELDRICEMSGESVRLTILDGTDAVCIEQKNSPAPFELRNAIGTRSPSYCNGAGKALLAFLEPEKQSEILRQIQFKRLTSNTIIDPKELKAELDIAKARGYAINDEEQTLRVRSVASPILDYRSRPLAAISIIGPSDRLVLEKLHVLGRDLIEASRRVSGNVGHPVRTLSTVNRPLGPDNPAVSCILPSTAFVGDGPYWSIREQMLFWLDILAPSLNQINVTTGESHSIKLPELIGAVADRRKGGLIAVTQFGFKTLDPESGALTAINDPEANLPENRFNDGKCDRAGRFWAGTLTLNERAGIGSLYRLDTEGRVKKMDTGFLHSNGLGWSPDNKEMYFTDTGKGIIYRYDFDIATGEIHNRRVFTEVPVDAGFPNGLTVDAEGYVWSANWDGWCVTRYDPTGEVERVINLPVPRPSSCMFGGANLDILYVTSGRIRLSAQILAEAPLSGSVFALDVGVRGLPEPAYSG